MMITLVRAFPLLPPPHAQGAPTGGYLVGKGYRIFFIARAERGDRFLSPW